MSCYDNIFENTIGSDIAWSDLVVKLIDSVGVTVDTSYIATSGWKLREKQRLEFSTMSNFEKIQVELRSYSFE